MLGVLVNTIAVIIGGTVGTLFKKGIPEKLTTAIMTGIGLCVVYIGIDGALAGDNALTLIVSMILGAILGTLIDIDDKLTRLGNFVERKFSKGDGKVSLSEGFVTGSLLFCVGSMTVVGSLNAGISGDNTMLFTKALLDLISSTVLATSCGIGVMLSSLFVLVFQGGIVLLAEFVGTFLSTAAINEMTCAGSVIIIALGLNLTGISKFKVANFMPAIFLAPFVNMLIELLPISL